MTDLRTAAQQALEAAENRLPLIGQAAIIDELNALRAALAQPEDKSQAAFEHWVETVEATQGCAISRNALLDVTAAQVAHADAACKQSLQVEPIIKPEIKVHNPEPPPEAQTEAEKIAYCAGWWAAMQKMREQEPVILHRELVQIHPDGTETWKETPLYTHPPRQWQGLTDEERGYFRACGFVGVSRVEEVLRAKNSTLACIPAVPPGLEDIEGKKGL